MKADIQGDAGDAAQAPAELTEETPGWLMINARVIIGLLGVVCLYAWLFISLASNAYLPQPASLDELFFPNMCFVLGAALSLGLCYPTADFLGKNKVAHFIIALACTVVGIAGILTFSTSFVPTAIFLGVLGLGFGLLYVLYGEYICHFFYGYIKVYVYGIFLAALLACTCMLFASEDARFVLAVGFTAVAFICYAIQLIMFDLGELPHVESDESDLRHHVTLRSYLSTATSGLAVGFASGCILAISASQPWVVAPTVILTLVVCIVMFTDAVKFNKIGETVMMRIFLPVSAVLAFPLIFVPDDLRFIFAILLLCWALVPTMCSVSAICSHVVIFELSAVRAIPVGRAYSMAGILLGMAIAFCGFTPTFTDALGVYGEIGSVVVFVLLVVFSASFVMTEDNYPDEKHIAQTVDEDGDVTNQALPGTPIRMIDAAKPEEESHEKKRPGIFKAKCEMVAKEYGLSRRQREVLILLAKGRNAEYVAEQLVISLHTAKAHIYNIYQKTGVHSRQELMDLVESMVVPEPAEK